MIVEDVQVTAGLFTVRLDFGVNTFAGDDRWLQIDVKPGAGGAFTGLSPRQLITPTPYSLQTRGMFVDTNKDVNLVDELYVKPGLPFVGVGRNTQVTTAEHFGIQAPAAGTEFGGMYIRTDSATAKPFYGYYAGTGTGKSAYHYYDGNTDNWAMYLNGTRLTLEGATGNLGVGTTNPKQKLHVNGDYYGRGHMYLYAYEGDGNTGTAYLQARDDSGTTDVGLRLRTQNGGSTVEAMHITPEGNIGMGVTSTSRKLDIRNNSGSDGLMSWNTGTGRAATFMTLNNAGASTVHIFGVQNNVATLWVQNTGSAPAIECAGTARVTVLEVTGADLAEKFPVSEEAEPGTVLEIDPDRPGNLRISREAYNHRVAGVVSGAGGLPAGTVMGNLPGQEKSPAVALSGRVWVKCDAGRQAIRPGDLLTTSTMPGHAMAAADHQRTQGAVIGKAMTALEQGQSGLVLVLVNLQ